MLNEMEKKSTDKKKKNKSKTFIENQKNELEINSAFDFANLYTSATETSHILKKESKHKSANDEISNQNQNEIDSLEDTPVSYNKKFSKSELKKLKTSTPNAPDEKHSFSSQKTFVKSIMKNNSTLDNDAADSYNEIPVTAECGKRKKRTKSVSFMLDDNNEVSKKKSKPNKYGLEPSNLVSKSKEKKKNVKTIDNNGHYVTQLDQAILKSDVAITTKKKKKKEVNTDISVLDENELKIINKSISNTKKLKNNSLVSDEKERTIALNQISGNEEFQKSKKDKKKTNIRRMTEEEEKNDNIHPVTEEENVKNKNKKKREQKIRNVEANKEESDKKNNVKTDNVVDDLESLSIGDNAHTLSNLLDEMTVADKNKKRKIKKNVKKTDTSEESLETDGKEKKDRDKWKKRRLHRKPEFRGNDVTTSIIVDNLPLKLLFDYKDLLREHFSKFGLIRRIGVAEVYPTEEPKPVFTTTVYFFSEEAATSALEEDNTAFIKGRMRVRRPLAPTDTTLIVKCHSPLDESTLSSTFLSCGRIRSIRKVEKSKKSISSAFIEFNHPQEVEKAVKLSSTLRIGGKKVYIAKFEIRNKKQEDKKDEANGEL